jgi:hypothetical protein
MSSVVISGDTSGAITIAAPAVAGTNTLTLPANTGTVITTASTFAGTGPAFSAYASGGQNVSNITFTKIQFNNENFDTNNNYDKDTNYRFQPTVAGYYQVNSVILFGGGVSGFSAYSSIYKNGTLYLLSSMSTPVSVSYGAGCSVSAVIYLNGSTDYVEIYAYQTSGTTLAMQAGNQNCQFSGALVRAA